jgi:hypothetical protein
MPAIPIIIYMAVEVAAEYVIADVIAAAVADTVLASSAGIITAGAAGAVGGAASAAATGGDVGEGALFGAAGSAAGTYVGGEVGSALQGKVDPSTAKALSGAASGATGAAVRGGDIGKSALIGGVAPLINDAITSGSPAGTPTTDPYARGDISTTGMDEPGYEAPPDQGGVPTPPEASSDPSLPPAQRMDEVLTTAERDNLMMNFTGLSPKMPKPTSPVTSKDLADPTVNNAPPPDKKSDYTGEISTLLRSLFRKDSGSGSGVRGGASGYELGGGSTGPGSAALAGALRTDAGAPIFGGEKKGKKRNVWNIESLRTKDETGA